MTPEVVEAIEEIKHTFPDHRVEVAPDGQGGAFVTVHGLLVGEVYVSPISWVGFQIPCLYPRADIYPHFMDQQVQRVDGRALGESFSGPVEWRGRSATQISRKSNRWDEQRDTAAIKLVRILDWINSR